jgi:tetratricopeptide (TPR) repeat protein
MKKLLIAGLLALAAPPLALAQGEAPRGALQVDARSEIAAALFAASATQAAAERAADAKLRAQAAEIARLRREGSANRTQIAALEERYVADLAAKDRAYAQEIAVFRAAVTDIAATPEGIAALARFNAGDEIGALAVLDQLRAARDKARQVRANIESAAEGRRIATLALEAQGRGRLAAAAVIARYEEVTRLDPGVHWDWVDLGRLYVDAGNLPQARRAAERAAETAGDARDRSVAAGALGDVQVLQGDLRAALQSFEQIVAIIQRLAAADPSSASLQRDVSVSLERVGDVAIAQGDLAGARGRFEQSLAIFQRLAAADPSSARLQRDVWVSM